MDNEPGRVLILNYNGSAQEVIDKVSAWPNCRVDIARSSREALKINRSVQIDVVICDIDMQNVNWEGWYEEADRLPFIIPTIILRRRNSVSDISRDMYFGAKGFVVKPQDDWEGLEKSVTRCIEFGKLRRENTRYRQQLEEKNTELQANMKVLEQDLQAGRHVQMRMLPQSPLEIGEYIFSHAIIPSLYLSGDFTDYFKVGATHAVFFMADVSGHGSSSAFVTVLLKNLFARKRSDYLHRVDGTVLNPANMLETANDELLRTGIGKHVTLCVGVIDFKANSLIYSIAGHLPLPILVSDGGISYLQGKGSPVGLFEQAVVTQHSIELPEKFMLALFSDGILEILPPQNLIEKEQYLLKVFEEHYTEGGQQILQHLGAEGVTDAPDDIAALFVSRSMG